MRGFPDVVPTVSRAALFRMVSDPFYHTMRLIVAVEETLNCFFCPALIAVSNLILFAFSGIHQSHERFGDVSRERQCAFMSLSENSFG